MDHQPSLPVISLLLLPVLSLLSLVSCGPGQPDKGSLTLEAPQPFSDQELTQKALAAYAYLLDNQQYVQQAGDVKRAAKLTDLDALSEALSREPVQDREAIRRKLIRELRREVYAEQQLIPEDDILHRVRKQLPRYQLRDRISLPTVKGRMVTGQISALTKSYVKVGSTKIIREDLPFDFRAQLWPEEYDKRLRRAVRDQQSRNRWAMDKFLPAKLAQALPRQLLAGGYLPNPRNPEASLQSVDLAHWLPRPRIVPLLKQEIQQKQAEKIESFWKSHGYVKLETAHGIDWVPKKKD